MIIAKIKPSKIPSPPSLNIDPINPHTTTRTADKNPSKITVFKFSNLLFFSYIVIIYIDYVLNTIYFMFILINR